MHRPATDDLTRTSLTGGSGLGLRALLAGFLALTAVGCGASPEEVRVVDRPAVDAPDDGTLAGPAAEDAASEAPADSRTPTMDAESEAPAGAEPTLPTAAEPEAADEAADEGGQLVLEGGSLGFASDSGSISRLEFGTDGAMAVRAVEGILGAVTGTQTLDDCGLEVTTWTGFSVYTGPRGFVGWSNNAATAPEVSTANGIALGITRAALEESGSVVDVGESTLGTEFTIGELAGLLSGSTADARVTDLWSGEVCIAR